jgi:hypothetical protein
MTHTQTLRRHPTVEANGAGVTLSALHPAYRTGRTIFSSRVFDADEVKRVLKDGHQSRKIGKTATKGHRRGWPIYTLTLEERATCPRTCAAWAFCYGNHMQASSASPASSPARVARRPRIAGSSAPTTTTPFRRSLAPESPRSPSVSAAAHPSSRDVLPFIAKANLKIAEARDPASPGGTRETLPERAGYLPELRLLQRELGALICQIEGELAA